MTELQRALEQDGRVAYALVFGSTARGTAHPSSDLDLAIGLGADVQLEPLELGELASDLETATGRTTSDHSRRSPFAASSPPPLLVDKEVLARKLAAIHEA